MMSFWNREKELSQIKRVIAKGGFGYVTGRRRVGKTALLVKACEFFGGLYHQAVEGTARQQLIHLVEDLKSALPIFHDITPNTWDEFFRLLSHQKLPPLLVFDEFPYWVQGDPALPSLLQKWMDHELPKTKTSVFVSGSSQSMLYSQFLNDSSPLYGRASIHLHLEPMNYLWFCKALHYKPESTDSFLRFSLVGGVPRYWKLLTPGSPAEQATSLYFEPSSILSEEPTQLLRDETITGALPKAMLDLVGRGVSKPSELAARLANPQGNLSRPLALLLDLNLIHRELPFGESPRTTKRVLYSIEDPALSFYYGSCLPNSNHWQFSSPKEKLSILNRHASRHWEIFCRKAFPESSRYWEGSVEIDLVAPQQGKKTYLIAECKWTDLTKNEEEGLLKKLKEKFTSTRLNKKLGKVDFRIFFKKDLPDIAFLLK